MTQLFIQRLFSQHCKCYNASGSSSGSGCSSEGSRFGGSHAGSMLRQGSLPPYAAFAGGSGAVAAAGGNIAGGYPAAAGACSPLMDFAAFCTFCAAWEQRHAPAAVRYFFQILDLEGRGHLAPVRPLAGWLAVLLRTGCG